MVGKRSQALLASGLLLVLLCLDASPVSSFRERAEPATEGSADLVSVGANRSLLKKNNRKKALPDCDEVADAKAVPGVDCLEHSDDEDDHDNIGDLDHDLDYEHREDEEDDDTLHGEGDEAIEDDHDHDGGGDQEEDEHGEGEHDGDGEGAHKHEEPAVGFLSFLGKENPLDHALEVLGVAEEDSVVSGDTVERLLAMLRGKDNEEDDSDTHGHDHGHDHSDEHEDEDEVEFRLTAEELVDRYGSEEGLTQDRLDDACLAILACQVDERCTLGEEEDTEEEEDGDDLMNLKSIASGVLFVEVLLGGTIPYIMRYLPGQEWYISLLNTFSGGVILATGLVHLVPEVIEEQFAVDLPNEYPLGMVMMTAGFLLVFLLEHILFDGHSHTEPEKKNALERYRSGITTVELRIMQSGKICTDKASGLDTRSSLDNDSGRSPASIDEGASGLAGFLVDHKNGVILLVAMTAHGLLEGFVVGFQDERSKLLILLASVASHKGAAAMALSARFLKTGATFLQAFCFVFVFALMGPLSIFLGTVLDDVPSMVHLILNGLASGTFVYIGAYEVVHEEFSDGEKPRAIAMSRRLQRTFKFLSMVLGTIAIALLALIPHEHTD